MSKGLHMTWVLQQPERLTAKRVLVQLMGTTVPCADITSEHSDSASSPNSICCRDLVPQPSPGHLETIQKDKGGLESRERETGICGPHLPAGSRPWEGISARVYAKMGGLGFRSNPFSSTYCLSQFSRLQHSHR